MLKKLKSLIHMSKYPIRFRSEDLSTHPLERTFVIVTSSDVNEIFPYDVREFIYLDKNLHETTFENSVCATIDDGDFWMPLPRKMLTIRDTHTHNFPSHAVAKVQRDEQIH